MKRHSQGSPLNLNSRQCRSLTLASRIPLSQNCLIPSSTASPISASASMIHIRSCEWNATAIKMGSGSGAPCINVRVSLEESRGQPGLLVDGQRTND